MSNGVPTEQKRLDHDVFWTPGRPPTHAPLQATDGFAVAALEPVSVPEATRAAIVVRGEIRHREHPRRTVESEGSKLIAGRSDAANEVARA